MLASFRSLRCGSSIFNPAFQRSFATAAATDRPRGQPPSTRHRLPRPKRKPLAKKLLASKTKKRDAAWFADETSGEKLTLVQAVHVLRAIEVINPKASIDMCIKTRLSTNTTLPKGPFHLPKHVPTKNENTFVVFASGRDAEAAKNAGAHFVGGSDMIEHLLSDEIQPTAVICTPQFIKEIAIKLGKHLGPKGLMPSTKKGTVVDNPVPWLKRKMKSVEWRADKQGRIQMPVAKMDFTVEEILANIRTFLNSVKLCTGNMQPPTTRGRESKGTGRVVPLGRVMLSSSRGPSIQLADF